MKLEARGLARRFGAIEALRGVDFTLASGARAALVGPNGSGKSTLLRILMGLLRYEGFVHVDGRDPFRERMAVAARMAYVPQLAPRLAVPADEWVRVVGRVRPLDHDHLHAVADRLELPLAELRGRPFRGLSGGTQQKLLIAVALASRASLYVLDEPTGSLDPLARERLFALLRELPGDATVLLCSHRLEEVRRLVDQVLVLEEGRLAWQGEAATFLDRAAAAPGGDLRELHGAALGAGEGLDAG